MAVLLLGIPFSLVLSLLLLDPRPVLVLWIVVAPVAALYGWLAWRRRDASFMGKVLALILAVSLGWQLAGHANQRFSPWPLDAGQTYFLSGTVNGLPDSRFHRHRILLQPDCVSSREDRACDLWSGASPVWPLFLEITIPARLLEQPPRPGQRWEFQAHVQPADGPRQPGGFDAARWYRSQHVVARFLVEEKGTWWQVEDSAAWLDRARFALREALQRQAEQVPPADRAGLGIPLALVTGDRTLMTAEHWALFNATGTTHLVAISGSHIVLVAGAVLVLLRWLFRHWLWLTARVPASLPAALGAFATAWLYGAIAGFGLPVQRALLMLAVFVALQLAGRVQQRWFALALAFCLVLVWDPMATFSLGFWLSFMAVYWILWMSGGALFRPGWIRGWLQVQTGIFVGLAPVLLWQLQSLSLVSGVTNAFAMPLVGLVLTPLALVWALAWGVAGDAANILLVPAGWITDVWLLSLEWFASWPLAVLQLPPRPASAMLLGLAGALWLCTAGLPGRVLAPLLFLPMLQPLTQSHARPAELWLPDSGGPLQLAQISANQVLFIGQSPWPQWLPRWQQSFLTLWGVEQPGANLTLENTGALWAAESWTLTQLTLRTNILGEPDVERIRFDDLCVAESDAINSDAIDPTTTVSTDATTAPRREVLYRKGNRCLVRLSLGGELWLLWPTLAQADQRILLQPDGPDLEARYILLQPTPQDRLLPDLLARWQRQDAELLLTDVPAPALQRQLERSAIRFRVLAGSGPQSIPLAGPSLASLPESLVENRR